MLPDRFRSIVTGSKPCAGDCLFRCPPHTLKLERGCLDNMKTKGSTVVAVKNHGKETAGIALMGKWIAEMGFTRGTIVLVEKCEPGFLSLKACGKGMEVYKRLVKDALSYDMKVLQVSSTSINSPCLKFSGGWLGKWGFAIGDVIAVGYENGLIYIRCIGQDKFGF